MTQTIQQLLQEDLEDIENLYKSITETDKWVDIKTKLKIHIWYKKRRFNKLMIKE